MRLDAAFVWVYEFSLLPRVGFSCSQHKFVTTHLKKLKFSGSSFLVFFNVHSFLTAQAFSEPEPDLFKFVRIEGSDVT